MESTIGMCKTEVIFHGREIWQSWRHVVTFLPPTFEGVLAHDFSRGSLYD